MPLKPKITKSKGKYLKHKPRSTKNLIKANLNSFTNTNNVLVTEANRMGASFQLKLLVHYVQSYLHALRMQIS